jgi:hypothetical protein
MALFDLSKNNFSTKADAGYEFELTSPETFEGTGVFITVRGDNSPAVKAFSRRKFQEYQQREVVAKRKNKEVDPMTLDDAEELAVENAVVRTIGWKGLGDKGVEIPFSKEKAEEIFSTVGYEWIREAVIQESSNLRNFL